VQVAAEPAVTALSASPADHTTHHRLIHRLTLVEVSFSYSTSCSQLLISRCIAEH